MNKRILSLVCSFLLTLTVSYGAVSSNLVTKDATEGAVKLYNFLKENYGSKTISGIQTGDMTGSLKSQPDVKAVYEKSDKYPALVGLDLLMATGHQSDESWFMSYTENSIKIAEELWKEGGIPAFTWHWKVGKDSVFYTKDTNFDFTKGFLSGTTNWDTSSETYKLLVADIDKISKHFQRLQTQGIAAIWRPIHEAAGGWFWWGSKGAEAYKALYALVYDRMVNTNGLKNLVWVWNIERDPAIGYDYKALNGSWYPGDEYVDIIGVDIYNSAFDYNSNVNSYNKIVSEMGTNKIIALTENGPIVTPDNMEKDNAVWSWWMPWYETWNGGYVSQTSEEVWKATMADERIITLDEMPGWGTYTEYEDPICSENAAKGIYEVECSSDYEATSVSVSNFSGTGALNLANNTDYVNINVKTESAGGYKVYVGYNTVYGYKQISCAVNGISGIANLGENGVTESVDEKGETLVGTFNFNAGDNVVSLTPNWTWAVVDYVRIEKDENAPSYEFTVSDVDGFKVDGAKLLDRCGNEFVMRGVNLAYTWYESNAYSQLEAVANAGANTVRVVLTDGKAYGKAADPADKVMAFANKCKEYGMLTILEVHDETGSNDIADLKDAAKYFANMAESLKGTESYIIINIANEWHNDAASTVWRDGYKEAIKIIRDAGLRHCIMVDAGGYGQGAATIHSHGLEVLDSDPENNLIFSIHMYGGAGNTNKVKSNIDGVINQNLALCIGEFGWYHSDGDVDEDLILSYCQEKKVSWLAWSWYGNGSPVEYLDMVKDPSANPTLASYDNITIKNWNGSQSWTGLSCDWGKKIIDTWKTEAAMPTLTKCASTSIEDDKSDNQSIQYSAEEQSLQIINKEKNPFYIYDMQGVCIYTSSEEEVTINTSQWVNGAYIVVTRDENFRFIKY
ncbi:MAG: cellulase family glycosylhydrolase [Paludibacteraceae bacterium]|nr:cellulase family glycosylhydrolase [Paludibacteraceae bacterium]